MKLLVVTAMMWASAAFASDCGLGHLTQNEKDLLTTGQIVQRADWKGGIQAYRISSWGLINAASLKDAVAQYYDYKTYKDSGNLVEMVSLSPGEKSSNNPVHYDVTPKDNNPFGALYQPFTFVLNIQTDGQAYVVNGETVTSPNLLLHYSTSTCFVRVQSKVLVSLDGWFNGNPKIGFDIPGFGPEGRQQIWSGIVAAVFAKSSQPASVEQLTNLGLALRAVK